MEKRKEEIAEDVCFICKDGGNLMICDFEDCLKAYHVMCVGKDPQFLESAERWTCGWHSCFLCGRSSIFQCFCCPRSLCSTCIGVANFVQLRATKGFCIECLKLLLMIVDDIDVDTDGGKVDFKDTETLEYLFKDYWPIVKEHENLSDDDIHKAHELFRKSELKNHKTDLDENSEYVVRIDLDDSEGEDGKIGRSFVKTKGISSSSKVKKIMRRYKSKKKQFIGWGSKELVTFLQSIGKATEEAFTQQQVFDVVKEYIQENKLLNPHKRRRVLCDSRLRALFGRKSICRLKINDLLDSHFAANEIPDDELNLSSEDENYEKTQRLSFEQKSRKSMRKSDAKEVKISVYACITAKNIRAVYLRRSLIEEFLRSPNTLASKLTGCFVRIRSDVKVDFRNSHQLVQITGTKEIVEDHKTGDSPTNIVLLVSNQEKDVHIHMVSDDDFSEDECQELGELVKQGLLKRPTVEELEKKALALHEDITNHRIKKDMILLQNLIKRANEKGWRRELMEYAEKLEILQRPAEQKRLLQEVPTIVADAEKGDLFAADNGNAPMGTWEGAETANAVIQGQESGNDSKGTDVNSYLNGRQRENSAANPVIIIESPQRESIEMKISVAATKNKVSFEKSGVQNAYSAIQSEDNAGKGKGTSIDNPYKEDTDRETGTADAIIIVQSPEPKKETQEAKEYTNGEHETQSTEECCLEDERALWWKYMDLSGVVQGPFSLEELREWHEEGYFPDDFKIWRSNQCQENAVLLIDALHQESLKLE